MAPSRRGRGRGRRGKPQDAEYLLELFTHADLTTWRIASEAYEEFHVRLFFHLEGLRKLHHDEMCAALQDSVAISMPLENWVRIIDFQYCTNPLSVRGSIIQGKRFNIGKDLNPKRFPTFPALYLADRYETAYAETHGAPPSKAGQVFSGPEFGQRTPGSFMSIDVSGHVENLFDLRRARNLNSFVEIIRSFEIPDDLEATSPPD